MPHLFSPFTLRSVTLRNRIGVSPMCQYSAIDGVPNEWHSVHLGSRAVGGAGLIIAEATGVEAQGRITLGCTGLWNDSQTEAWQRIVAFGRAQGAVMGVQLGHAGRKASTLKPWEGNASVSREQGGYESIGPSALAFSPNLATPRAMTLTDIQRVQNAFCQAATHAIAAGFQVIELHAAHGYLLHSFLSPLSNQRADAYGGSFDNRTRLLREIVQQVRRVIPDATPLLVRLSCSDWVEGGWTLDESIALARLLQAEGVDLIDCSSGGAAPNVKIPVGPGYQVPFAAAIRREASIATAAVGLITEPTQANDIINSDAADLTFLARELLRDPYWPHHAAKTLGQPVFAPIQYGRVF